MSRYLEAMKSLSDFMDCPRKTLRINLGHSFLRTFYCAKTHENLTDHFHNFLMGILRKKQYFVRFVQYVLDTVEQNMYYYAELSCAKVSLLDFRYRCFAVKLYIAFKTYLNIIEVSEIHENDKVNGKFQSKY